VTVLLVAAGGVIGVLARYGLGTAVSADALPWVTVAINIAGSFLLGVVTGLGASIATEVRTAVSIGLLGGFTTFSTFSVDVVRQLDAGDGLKAVLYVAASLIGGVAAAAAGYYAGRALSA